MNMPASFESSPLANLVRPFASYTSQQQIAHRMLSSSSLLYLRLHPRQVRKEHQAYEMKVLGVLDQLLLPRYFLDDLEGHLE
jgi:hypothetical protein